MTDFNDKNNRLIDDNDEYIPEIIDLDGEPFEAIDMLEVDGTVYVALVPYVEDLDDESEEEEFIIMREVEKDGEYFLESIDDESLYEKIGDLFIKHLNELFESLEDQLEQ